MPAKKLVVPSFRSEREETLWWEKNRTVVEADLRSAMRQGKALTLSSVLAKSQSKNELRPVTLRLPNHDIETARQLAGDKGIGYQTYIKLLLHDALRKEAGRQARNSG